MNFFRGFFGGNDAPSSENSVAVTTSLATTGEINYQTVAGGQIYIPAGSSITSLTFYVSNKPGGTYYNAYDSSSMSSPVAIVLTVAAGYAYPLPSDLFGAGSIKMVGDAAGTVYFSRKG